MWWRPLMPWFSSKLKNRWRNKSHSKCKRSTTKSKHSKTYCSSQSNLKWPLGWNHLWPNLRLSMVPSIKIWKRSLQPQLDHVQPLADLAHHQLHLQPKQQLKQEIALVNRVKRVRKPRNSQNQDLKQVLDLKDHQQLSQPPLQSKMLQQNQLQQELEWRHQQQQEQISQ